MPIMPEHETDAAFIKPLDDLRDKHRLAIHMWEDEDKFKFPKRTWSYFTKIEASQIPTSLEQRTIPLLSMSLLPDMTSGKSMAPYGVNENRICDMSYLVDLDQGHEHAAKVVRVDVKNLGTGNNVYNKQLKLDQKMGIESLDKLYHPFESHPQEWLKAVARENQSQHTNMQLDALGNHMQGITKITTNIVPWNEIVVAANAQHIAAICVPVYASASPPAWHMPFITLSGALAGLQHIDKGQDLPVVYYHVSPPHHGTFELLGRGKEQLMQKALEAIKALDAIKKRDVSEIPNALQLSNIHTKAFRDLCKEVNTCLGIDLTKSLNEQRAAVMALERAASNIERS